MKYPLNRILYVTLLCASLALFPHTRTHAAILDMKAVSIQPETTTDFSSDQMKQNLRDIKDLGANEVTLIIPYYQNNRQSTAMYPGWNTPTDDALTSAISYAHSIGLRVMLKPHLETDYIEWRGNIDPALSDRSAWFQSYTTMLLHYGQLAQTNTVEDYCIGTELLHLSNPNYDPNNTANWDAAIAAVRGIYNGKLTYSANWYGELDTIQFWDKLDYIGVSGYYDLTAPDNSVASISQAWDTWRVNMLQGIHDQFNKPIVFTEVGYRTIVQAYRNPWDWSRQAAYNETDQANSYQALYDYWKNYSWVNGISLWRWNMQPNNQGDSNFSDYSPQYKQAQQVIKTLWTVPTNPNPPLTDLVAFTSSGSISSQPVLNQSSTISVTVTNKDDAVSDGVVDVEIFDTSTNQRALQKFFEHESFTAGQSKTYTVNFTPTNKTTYRVDVGTFSSGWASLYSWNWQIAQVIPNSDSGIIPPIATSTNPISTSTPPTATSTSPVATSTLPMTPTSTSTDPTSKDLNDGQPMFTVIDSPISQAHLSNTVTFKAYVKNRNLNEYNISWQLDGGELHSMNDSSDGTHKEASVDVSSWALKPGHTTYHLDFVSIEKSMGAADWKGFEVYVDK